MTKGNQGRFLLLYGSQTGQAKAIAEEIFEASPNYGLDPEMHCFSLTDKKFSVEKETCVVIIVSTTGEGDPPDTSTKFWRRIKKKTLASDHLSQLHFTLLGLGDSNYTNFCRNGKNFDHRLGELGASHFYPPGFADDATGLEIVAEPWIEGLYPALRKHLSLNDVSDCQTNCSVESGRVIPEAGPSREEKSESIASNSESGKSTMSDSQAEHLFLDAHPSSGVTETDAVPVTDPSAVPSKKSNDENHCPDSSTVGSTGKQYTPTSDSRATLRSNQEASPEKTEDAPTEDPSTDTTALVVDHTDSSSEGRKKGVSVEKAREPSGTLEEGPSPDEAEAVASLRWSVSPLAESSLTLPILPAEYLEVEFHSDQTLKTEDLPFQGGAPMPSAASPITMATVVAATRLTRYDAVKTALDMEIDISESEMDYRPGDSFSVICPNDGHDVRHLIQRLGLDEKADWPMSLKVIAETKKRRAAVPDYIPRPLCTLRHALLHCCEIQSPLKKAFLRVLVDHTTDASEKRRLQELCSKQGAADYGTFIRDPHLSLLDVLTAFPSCSPPLGRLFEHLPRLQPRPYSISSSPLACPQRLHFVFNVVVFPEGQGRWKDRRGVCTGWLSSMTLMQQPSDDSLAGQMSGLGIHSAPKIPIFERANQHFHLPADPTTPIIMIGPGTGVAPFVGFLQHRECLRQTGVHLGATWLFFGCRHKDRDFLYREALEGHLQTGVLSKLCLSFSRDVVPPDEAAAAESTTTTPPRYVQDNMRAHAGDLCHWILEDNAVIYVCGDAKSMAKNVNAALSDIFIQEKGKTAYEAACLLATLRDEKRYVEDVWT